MSSVKVLAEAKSKIELSDATLIERCLKGEQDAWETIIRRYQNLIYSVPIRYHFSSQDAADVFQHVCVILLEKLKTLRNSETLSSWLYITTKRQCWKIAKKKKMETELQETSDEVSDSNSENLVLQHQIKTGVDQLSGKCRDLIFALYYADPPYSYDQITEKLAIPFGSIGPTRARCLEKLRKMLSGKE
jgi:RNA polymerase sigma factor (sigma-70 family)